MELVYIYIYIYMTVSYIITFKEQFSQLGKYVFCDVGLKSKKEFNNEHDRLQSIVNFKC